MREGRIEKMIRYKRIAVENESFHTMLTLAITDEVEIVHCIENSDTTVFTASDEFELTWKGDILELVLNLINVPAQQIGDVINQLKFGKKQQMLS